MEKLLLKPTEVAEVLRIGRSLVYGLLATGELPSIKVGRCIRVPKASLDKWISDQEHNRGDDRDGGGVNRPCPNEGLGIDE